MELRFPIKHEELRKKLRIKKDLKTALRKKKDAVITLLWVSNYFSLWWFQEDLLGM